MGIIDILKSKKAKVLSWLSKWPGLKVIPWED